MPSTQPHPYYFRAPPATPFEAASIPFPDLQSNSLEAESCSAGPSRRSTPKRKHDDAHVRRPPNPFILFACEYRKCYKGENKNNRDLSKEAGALWKVMPEEDKEEWKRRAAVVKERHAEVYPDYRYQPRRRDGPRHPHIPSSEQDSSSGIVFLPPLSSSSPRRSTRRSARKVTRSGEVDDASIDSFSLDSPTRRTAGFTSNLTETSPDHNLVMTLPCSTLQQLQSSPEPVAGPSSKSMQQPVADNEVSDFFDILTKHSQQVDSPRLTFDPFSISSISSAVYDPFMPGTTRNETYQHNATAEADHALFFSQYGFPTRSNPIPSISDALDPTCNSYRDNGGLSDRR